MSALDTEPFPRGALVAVAALITLSIVGAGAARLARLETLPSGPPESAAKAWNTEELRFTDGPDGSVAVRDAGDNRLVSTLPPGTGGFVRDVMRGLAHDRKVRGIDAGPPFRLTEWAGGRLVLEDPATGRQIDLEAFGTTNRDAFLQLLHPKGPPS
jgi:putative photosynthetic complex assembly protein